MKEFYNRGKVGIGVTPNRKKSWRWLGWMSLCLMFLMGTTAFAQASNYTFAQSSGTYVAITGGSVATTSSSGTPNLDSYVSGNITIPSFTFAGIAYTKMYVTGNGVVALGTSTPASSTYTVLSSTTGGNVFLAPFSADLDDNTGISEIRYETIGNEFIVQWKNFRRYGITESINFQVRMNTSTGVVNFVYDGIPPYGSSTLYQPQVGIKSAAGNYNALTVAAAGSWNTPVNITTGIVAGSVATFNASVGPTSGLTYKWAPLVLVPCVTPSAAPTELAFGTTTSNTINGSFTAASPAPSKYLVVRSTSATPPTPVDGTVYAVGATTLGTGTNVRSVSNATTFSDTGLTAETLYYYYVFSYNDLCTGAPFYNTTSLSGSQNTLCTTGTSLGTNSITATSANVTWTGSGNYILEYGTTGFTPGTGSTPGVGGTIASSTATSPYALAGLSSSSSYQVYVRQVCSLGGYSPNSSATSFSTLCTFFSAPTTIETFSLAVPPSTCWSRNNGLLAASSTLGTSTAWISDDFSNVTSPVNKAAKINLYGTSRKDWLITPSYDLGNGGNFQLEFDLALTVFGSLNAASLGVDDKFAVVISTDNGVTWSDANILQQWTSSDAIPNGDGVHATIDLSAYTGLVRIGFYAESTVSNADNDLFVDNIIIATVPVLPPNCATGHSPVDLATNVVRNSTLTWTAATGSPLSYDVYFGTSTSPALVANVTGTSYTPATMDANTTFYWKVVPKNANGDATGCAERSFTTGTSLFYCPSVPTSNDNSGITSVKLGSTTFPVTDVTYYSYPTTIDFAAGTSNASSITFATGYEYTTNIWIDLNDNGVFEGSELLYEGVSTGASPTTLNTSFLLSASAPLGVHKMRIGTADGGQTPPNPCYSGSYGVTIDAMINITAPPACLAPTALLNSGITATTATVSWTAPSTAPSNGYNYEIRTSGDAGSGATGLFVAGSTAAGVVTANITGLTSSTSYSVYVQSKCGESETSTWASGGSFITACASVSTFPFVESFEGITTGIPTCWQLGGTTTTASNNFSSFATGQTGKGLRFNSYFNSNGLTGELTTPTLDLSSLTVAELKFHFKNPTGGNFEVLISSNGGTTYTSLESSLTGQVSWLQKTYDVTSYISSNVKIKFVGTSNYGDGDAYVYLDEIIVQTPPSCVGPTTLVSSAVTTTTATLSWTASASSPSNGYDIYYSNTNTAPLAGTVPTVINNPTATYNATGLSSSSTYYWWVRSDCGSETSTWASGGSFNTITPPPTNENCAGAIALVCNAAAATYSSAGSTAVAPAGCALGSKGIWFSFMGTSGEITINSTATFDHKLSIQTGSCSELTWIACKDGSTGAETYTIANSVLNQTYYVYVAHYSGTSTTTGNITISIACAAVCPTGIWTGTTSSDWNIATNWSDGMVPEACTAVTVNVANPLVISTDVTVVSMNLGALANVTVNETLNVGNITVTEGGSMIVANNAAVLQTALATNSGKVTVKRNSAPLFRQDYTLWSSPVSGQNLRNFSPLTLFNRFSSYNTAAGTQGDYVQEIVTTEQMETKLFTNAKGYLIRMPNNWDLWNGENPASSYLGSFKGTLNNGAVTLPLSGANTRFNLVGNPYPSPISIATFFGANTEIVTNTLYFWRKKASANTLNTGSGYASYTELGIASTDPSIDGTTPLNIEVGQGFFVVANSASPGNVVFNNTMRNNGAATFYKGANSTTELHRMWLNLSNATSLVGQTLIGYKTGATQGFDTGIDAVYFNDSATALTSIMDNNEYIIQGRSLPFVDTDVVPLGFKTEVAGSYTISLANFDGLFAENQDIFLKDNATNTLHNLKVADYTFTTELGVFNERFEVTYNSTLSTSNPSFDANSILIGVKNQQIKINAGSIVMEKIELIDVAGRVIYTQKGVNATTATIENVMSSNQMLIVRISTAANGVVNQKIVY